MPVYAADRIVPASIGAVAACFVGLTTLPSPLLAASRPASKAPITEIPLPPPRPKIETDRPAPDADADLAGAEIPLPPSRPVDLETPPPPATVTADAELPAEESACRERLTQLGVRFEPLPAIVNGQCGAPYPLRVLALPDGVQIPAPATLVCPAAEALARWTREVVVAEAARHLEAQLTRIAAGTSYECRNQNRAATGKLSEHAFANGVDISGFEFKGRKAVTVGEHAPETPEALFQQAVRSQACTYFTTVLGPGSDAAHATHLHLDLRGRGRGFRLCQ
jgi:hypothetical protein